MGKDTMTDAEAWAVFAETIEGAGFVPCLCWLLLNMEQAGAISSAQSARLGGQLLDYRAKFITQRHSAYYWPIWEVKPRIAACRKLARLVARGAK